MFGYIRPAAERLDARENERFRAVYCGLCHNLGRRYGFAARFLLNFDFTFLAILLSSGADEPCRQCRCAVHPCKGRCAQDASDALDAAADHSVILSWWQVQDHIRDSGTLKGLKYRIAALLLKRAYRRARQRLPAFDRYVCERLSELAGREMDKCASLDAAAEPFARLMERIASQERDERKRRVLEQIFYHLGRWIYLIDAADDYARDAKSGNYNPLRYRYGSDTDELTGEMKQSLAKTLDDSVHRMASAYALWDFGVWTPILDSIFYESFYVIGTAVLSGSYHKPKRVHDERARNEETT